MKTIAERKFDTIIQDCFHTVLKPLEFKKKGNNFYRQLPDLGQIINVQKSTFNSKERISFTINTGIFIPEYWLTYYTYHDGKVPEYPTEPVCAIRQRIGDLKYNKDKWFDIETGTDVNELKEEMLDNILNYIMPYFERTKTKEGVCNLLQDESIILDKFTRLIVFGEYGYYEKAQAEFYKLNRDKFVLNNLKSSLAEYKNKYKLNE